MQPELKVSSLITKNLMIVLKLLVLLLKILQCLLGTTDKIRNGSKVGWWRPLVLFFYLVKLQNGKVIRWHQDQIRSRTEQFSATTVNSPGLFDSNESLLSAPTSTFVSPQSPPSSVPLHRYPQRTRHVPARWHDSIYVRYLYTLYILILYIFIYVDPGYTSK